MITAHTDVVGSLLRPPALLQAREDVAAGKITQAEFKRVEDRAVDAAVALQEEAGLDVVTDGEMRRLSFQAQMTEAVEGFGEWDIDAFLWGRWKGDESVGNWSKERPKRIGVAGSELRNPRIAQIFYEIGWAEQKGTGIRAMRRAMEDLGLTPPTFESDPQDRSFRVTFYRHHFMDQSDLAWLEQFADIGLSTEEQKALVYAHKTGRVDNAAFRSLNYTDTLTASRALTHLEGLGLLRRSEQRRGPGVYHTLAEELAETPQVTPQVTPQSVAELTRLLAEGKRLPRGEMVELLVALCAEHPRTARELAQLLHRNMKYLRDTYLSPLVGEGRLELTGAPNDPNVAYRAAGQPETD